MDYKKILAETILYVIKRIEMAEFDLNITQEEVYEGEIYGLSKILSYIDMALSGEDSPDENLANCMRLIREVLLEEMNEWNKR